MTLKVYTAFLILVSICLVEGNKKMSVKFPGTIEALTESQTILVKFQQLSFAFSSYCHVNYKGNALPSADILVHEMKEQPFFKSSDSKPYTLYPREMVAVDSLTCI
ncbi:hypothetical protein WA538_001279, partial [Blastocystis sp. DL]